MNAWILTGLLAALALGAALSARAEDETPSPGEGDEAPDFRLNDQDGRAVRLSEHAKDSWAVLAFFPKAATPGCTREVCSLRDASGDLEALGVRVLAASLDDVRAQKQFAEDQQLAYPVLSDPDGSVARKYGVLGRGYANRVTFVIDPERKIRLVDRDVDVVEHGDALARRIRELQGR